MTMTRKEFLTGAALTVAALGCGGGGGANDCGVTIELNHGHRFTVAKADATAGAEKTYHIQGGADHDHTVTITAAQFSSVEIGLATHDHNVTVNCA